MSSIHWSLDYSITVGLLVDSTSQHVSIRGHPCFHFAVGLAWPLRWRAGSLRALEADELGLFGLSCQ